MIFFRGHLIGDLLTTPVRDVGGAFPRTAQAHAAGTWRSSSWDSRRRRGREARPGAARGFAAAYAVPVF